jgi:hypothetical protein
LVDAPAQDKIARPEQNCQYEQQVSHLNRSGKTL